MKYFDNTKKWIKRSSLLGIIVVFILGIISILFTQNQKAFSMKKTGATSSAGANPQPRPKQSLLSKVIKRFSSKPNLLEQDDSDEGAVGGQVQRLERSTFYSSTPNLLEQDDSEGDSENRGIPKPVEHGPVNVEDLYAKVQKKPKTSSQSRTVFNLLEQDDSDGGPPDFVAPDPRKIQHREHPLSKIVNPEEYEIRKYYNESKLGQKALIPIKTGKPVPKPRIKSANKTSASDSSIVTGKEAEKNDGMGHEMATR